MASNRYFYFVTSLVRLVQQQFARSKYINDRLDDVSAGFGTVQTEMDLKAPLASPTFTGTVTMTGATAVLLPSVALAEATLTKAATLQYVKDVLGAAGTLIPPQAGNAGKILQTDGTSYTWQLRLPAQTGKSRQLLSSDGTTDSWRSFTGLVNGYLAVTASTTITTEDRLIDITSATEGISVTLPDATTLFKGETFLVSSAGSAGTQGVLDSQGSLLASTQAGSVAILSMVLTDNTTAAGTWKQLNSSNSGVGPVTSLLSARYMMGTSTTLRSAKTQTDTVAIDGSRTLCASLDASGVDLYVATVTGTDVAIGAVVNKAVTSPVWMKMFSVTGGYLLLVSTTTTISVVGITVSGTTVSAGALTTVATCAITITTTNGIQIGYTNIAADAVGDKVLVGYRFDATANKVAVIQGLGTSVNVGGTTPSVGDSGIATLDSLDVIAVDTDKWLMIWRDETAIDARMCVITTSAVTPTPAAAVTIVAVAALQGIFLAGIKVSTTQVLISYINITAAATGTGAARLINITGTTPSAQAAVAVGGATLDGKVSITQVGSYYCAFFGASTSGASVLANLSVSGNVTTLQASTAIAGGSGYSSPPVTFDTYAAFAIGGVTSFGIYSLGVGSIVGLVSVADSFSDGGSINPGLMNVIKLTGKVGLHVASQNSNARVFRYGGF